MRTIELQVLEPKHCRTLVDPTNSGVTHIEAYLKFSEANKLKRGNANVRPPDHKKKPFKDMLETIETSPETFHLKNRGITFICPEGKYNEKDQVIVLSIPDASELREGEDPDDKTPRFGIADGGHTFEVVNQTIRDIKAYDNMTQWQEPFVRVHILITRDGNIEPIVEGLNTSLQVKNYTLDEYQGKFEPLKVALTESGFDPDFVAFREGEDKEWHVIEVIQRLSCFLKDRWTTSQPAGMYKSKGKALKLYTNEESRKEFYVLNKVMKDVLTLPEYIQSEFSRGGFVKAKSLGKLKCVKSLKKAAYTRPGTNYPTDHKIDMAALLPLAAGFRELLVKRGDFYEWRIPYKVIFERCSTDLYDLMAERVAGVFASSQLSSDIEFWTGAVMIISRARQEMVEGFPEKRGLRVKRKVDEDPEIVEKDGNKQRGALNELEDTLNGYVSEDAESRLHSKTRSVRVAEETED